MLKKLVICLGVASLSGATPILADAPKHNVVLFVPDGLRRSIVTADTAPTFAEIRDKGVNFVNSHSLFPTFTMPNSSGMATGHYLGDTGVFGNVLYAGFIIRSEAAARLAFIENDDPSRRSSLWIQHGRNWEDRSDAGFRSHVSERRRERDHGRRHGLFRWNTFSTMGDRRAERPRAAHRSAKPSHE
jgi:predicted AlkP superfamily pyrophosphatase or phosphodiesterase